MSSSLQTEPPPQSGFSAESFQNLKRKSVRSGAITFASQGASIVIQLASTVVLSRLLSPNDYGIMAMVMAVTGFAGLFRDLGLSSATIQRDQLTHGQASTLFWINVGVGFALTLILAACSPLVAWFYKKPELIPVTLALSSNFIISSIGSQPNAHLTRDLRFGKMAFANIASALMGLGISIAMGFAGFSYWSLVAGNIGTATLSSFLLLVFSGFRPGWFQRGTGVREMLKFGANITAFNFVNYFHRNLDKILIGRISGAEPLGMYNRAYSLLMFPISNLRGPINAVAFPAMSRLQNDPAKLRNYYLKTTNLLALLSMPLSAFMFVASKPIILILLGEKWVQCSRIFSYLALAAFIQPASTFAGSLLLSQGNSKRYFQCGLFNAVILSLSFVIGIGWGANGVALAYGIANYVILYPWLKWTFRGSSISFYDFVKACFWPSIISSSCVAVVYLCSPQIGLFSPIIQIAACLMIFVVIALVAAFVSSSVRNQFAMLANTYKLLNRAQ
jgi:PST family polysaccharide transporter